jgi:hypothetical protein
MEVCNDRSRVLDHSHHVYDGTVRAKVPIAPGFLRRKFRVFKGRDRNVREVYRRQPKALVKLFGKPIQHGASCEDLAGDGRRRGLLLTEVALLGPHTACVGTEQKDRSDTKNICQCFRHIASRCPRPILQLMDVLTGRTDSIGNLFK